MGYETRPPKINREWFRSRYGENFPSLLDSKMDGFLDTCIEDVYTLYTGIQELWDYLEYSVYESKTQMCYGLLVAWYITDLYPDKAVGVISSGGIPVSSKRIGNVEIKYADGSRLPGSKNNADLLGSLKSNSFGAKAYMMIKASGRMNYLRSR